MQFTVDNNTMPDYEYITFNDKRVSKIVYENGTVWKAGVYLKVILTDDNPIFQLVGNLIGGNRIDLYRVSSSQSLTLLGSLDNDNTRVEPEYNLIDGDTLRIDISNNNRSYYETMITRTITSADSLIIWSISETLGSETVTFSYQSHTTNYLGASNNFSKRQNLYPSIIAYWYTTDQYGEVDAQGNFTNEEDGYGYRSSWSAGVTRENWRSVYECQGTQRLYTSASGIDGLYTFTHSASPSREGSSGVTTSWTGTGIVRYVDTVFTEI